METMTLEQINARRATLIQQQQEVQLAEQAKRDAETEAQRQIAAAQAELDALELQAAAAQFEARLNTNRQFVNHNRSAALRLTGALNEAGQGIAAILNDEARAVDDLFQQQQEHAIGALNDYVASTAEPFPFANRDLARLDTLEMQQLRDYQHAENQRRTSAERQLENGIPTWAILAEWVQAAGDDAMTRQIRIGIVYALTGQLVNPPAGYNAHAAVNEAVNVYRNRGSGNRRYGV